MDKIIKKYLDKIDIIKNKEYENEEELLFLKTFYNQYNISRENIENIIKEDSNSIFLTAILCGNKVKSYQEAKKIVEYNKDMINTLPDDDLICGIFFLILDNIDLNKKEIISTEQFDIYPFNNQQFINLLLEINNIDIIANLIIFIELRGTIKRILNLPLDEQKYSLDMFFNNINKTNFYRKLFKYSFTNIRKYFLSLEKEKKEYTDNINNKVNYYEQIINDLSKDKLIEYNDSIKDNLDLIESVLIHNESFYRDINNKRAKYDNDIEYILKINNYNLSNINKDKINKLYKNANKQNIKEIISIINKEPFNILDSEDIFVDILLCSNKDILNSIINLVNKHYIDESFIYFHKNILLSNKYQNLTNYTCIYETLKNNINTYKLNKFNIQNIKNTNPDMLIINENELNKLLNLYKKYNINFNNQNNIDYKYITDYNSFKIIDQFIELGFKEYIKDNIELVYNNGEIIIKRILIATSINYNIWENNSLNDNIITGYNFPIKNKDLDNYIMNATNYYLDKDIINLFDNNYFEYSSIIELLDNNYLFNDNYLFDDIIISRNKVIKNISSINNKIDINNDNIKKVLFNAIIYNSILDIEQIDTIKSEINNLLDRKIKML